MSALHKPRRRLALRLAAAGFLAAIPLAVVALPANAATPADTTAPVVAQQIDDNGPWDHDHDRDHDRDRDRDHHDRDHDGDWNRNGDWNNNGWNNDPAPAPALPPTGSFG
ncbi:hypothetical protein ACFRAQ_23705 [Nocardia sp. NPDC056611]|uniref:hypothetical protein n=1 Tax=Nocardia sp. NPDC056611 TaxID=3345877 RepID=UPI00367322D8